MLMAFIDFSCFGSEETHDGSKQLLLHSLHGRETPTPIASVHTMVLLSMRLTHYRSSYGDLQKRSEGPLLFRKLMMFRSCTLALYAMRCTVHTASDPIDDSDLDGLNSAYRGARARLASWPRLALRCTSTT